MENTKNITFGLVFGWLFGILAGLSGITLLFKNPLPGVLLILVALISLPPASKMLKDKMNLSLSRGLKIVLVLILLVLVGTTMPESDTATVASSKEETSTTAREAIKVTATKLADDYKANEVAADAKYKGNLVEVSGTIGTIGKDITDTPYVTLTIGQYDILSVQCMFGRNDQTALATLAKGQSITLQGEVSGKLGNVLVRGCKIVQ